MNDLSSWIWVLIPLSGIAAGAFLGWAKLQAGRRTPDAANLEQAVDAIRAELKEQQAALERRVANLEVIVTSQTWDTLHDGGLSADEKKLLVETSRTELETLQQDLDERTKAELLARRIK